MRRGKSGVVSNYCIRIPLELRHDAEEVFAEYGMYLSEAINVFLRMAVKCNGLPFDLREPVISPTPMTGTSDQVKIDPDIINMLAKYTTQEIESALCLLKVLKAA